MIAVSGRKSMTMKIPFGFFIVTSYVCCEEDRPFVPAMLEGTVKKL